MSDSILQTERECFITGSTQNLERHHIYHGPRRKATEIFGCWVWLRQDIHRMLHDKGLYDDDLKEVCQARFEQLYSHETFMQVFGKSYLREEGDGK